MKKKLICGNCKFADNEYHFDFVFCNLLEVMRVKTENCLLTEEEYNELSFTDL